MFPRFTIGFISGVGATALALKLLPVKLKFSWTEVSSKSIKDTVKDKFVEKYRKHIM